MLTTILFDNDGVLVDTEALFYESCRVMMRQFDYELGEAEFAELSLSRGMSLADIIVGAGHSREAAKDARRERDLYYDRMLQERSASLVVDGVREVLAELHRDYRIGVVTCCQEMHFRTIHSASGIAEFFDFVVCDKDFINHKPHPEPYLKALEHAGVSAEEAIAVEDSERGISSALAAGLRTYAIPRGLSLYGKTGHATGCFKDIREFMDFIRRIER